MSKMSPQEIKDFLSENLLGRLGTVDENGQPLVTPVVYLYDGENLYFHTSPKSKKVKNIKKNPRVCFLVDEYRASPTKEKGVIVIGKAQKLEKGVGDLMKLMMKKASHVSMAHPSKRKTAMDMREMPLVFKIIPEKIISWRREE